MAGNLPLYVVPFLGSDDIGGDDSTSAPNLLTSSWDKVEKFLSGRDVNTTGMTPSMAKTAQIGKAIGNFGLIANIAAGVNSAISGYYAAKTAQYEAKSQASNYEFQSNMAAISAGQRERTAQSIEEAGKSRIAAVTMRAGQEKAGVVAEMAGHGIALGQGTTRDVAASMDLEKDLNVLAIHSNTTRQAWDARQQATDYRNESLLDRTSAVNARRYAGSISPMDAAMKTLVGSATKVAEQWDWNSWMRKRMAAGMPVQPTGMGVY